MAAVERTVELPVDAERVWDTVTAGTWLGDETELDPRVGGEGFVLDRGELRHVVVEGVEPGRNLTYRWWPLTSDGVGRATRVTIDVEPAGAGTRVVVIETPVPVFAPLPDSGPVALARV